MAINVQPVDGLIYRLLQQPSKPVGAGSQQPARQGNDRINLSAQAREQQPKHPVESSVRAAGGSGERSLEAHLLSIYKSHD